MLTTQELIESEITRLLKGDANLPEVSPACELADLRLSSLKFAELLIELEMKLGVDPFQGKVSIVEMRTVGDLVDAYDGALDAESANVR